MFFSGQDTKNTETETTFSENTVQGCYIVSAVKQNHTESWGTPIAHFGHEHGTNYTKIT